MLACVLDFKGYFKGFLEDHLHVVKFLYNNTYHPSIQMIPFEALYGWKCWSPVYWDNIDERKLLQLKLITLEINKVAQIRKHLKTVQDCQRN